jgi:hypothetical protein
MSDAEKEGNAQRKEEDGNAGNQAYDENEILINAAFQSALTVRARYRKRPPRDGQDLQVQLLRNWNGEYSIVEYDLPG